MGMYNNFGSTDPYLISQQGGCNYVHPPPLSAAQRPHLHSPDPIVRLAGLFVAAALFGAGFGAYLACDIHLAVLVLPCASERGKDIGIMHTAIYVPLVIGPWIGAGALMSPASFSLLFALALLSCVGAACLLVPIQLRRP